MCPYLSANYVSDCPPNMAQVSVYPDNLQWVFSYQIMHFQDSTGRQNRGYLCEPLVPERYCSGRSADGGRDEGHRSDLRFRGTWFSGDGVAGRSDPSKAWIILLRMVFRRACTVSPGKWRWPLRVCEVPRLLSRSSGIFAGSFGRCV